MSVTQQKSDLRALIHKKIKTFLTEHPEQAFAVAMRMTERLSATMTLEQLKQWHNVVYVMSQVLDSGSGSGEEEAEDSDAD